jgi:hypothetical protein
MLLRERVETNLSQVLTINYLLLILFKMKTNRFILGMFALGMLGFTSCSSDKEETGGNVEPTGKSKYVFVAYSVGSTGSESAPYIITADSLTGGKVNLVNGVETDAYSFVPQNNKLFAAVWGDQGPVTPYGLDSKGNVVKIGNTVNAPTAAIYNAVGTDSWVGGSWSGTPTSPGATIFRFDANNLVLSGRNTIDMSKMAIGTEWPTWYGVFEAGNNMLFLPYELSPTETGVTETKFRDSTWVLAVTYPGLEFKKIIRDGRTGPIGSWFGMHGMKQIEDGDVYAYSTAVKSKNPSAIVRIKKDTEVFDQSYFFNLEAKSGGLKVSRGDYVGNGKFLMSFFINAKEVEEWTGRTKLAIVDVKAQTITWVTGVPEHAQMGYKQKTFVEADKNTIRYVMKDDAGKHYVYNINASTATGTRGLEFENISDVTTISKIEY